jgi:hypothetical protein
MSARTAKHRTAIEHVLSRLHAIGISEVFGVPGDCIAPRHTHNVRWGKEVGMVRCDPRGIISGAVYDGVNSGGQSWAPAAPRIGPQALARLPRARADKAAPAPTRSARYPSA